MAKYNWSAWDFHVPGEIRDNFDDYRSDDTCPDASNTETPTPINSLSAEDEQIRTRYRPVYYPPGSTEDTSQEKSPPRIDSFNIYSTIQTEVFIFGNQQGL